MAQQKWSIEEAAHNLAKLSAEGKWDSWVVIPADAPTPELPVGRLMPNYEKADRCRRFTGDIIACVPRPAEDEETRLEFARAEIVAAMFREIELLRIEEEMAIDDDEYEAADEHATSRAIMEARLKAAMRPALQGLAS